MQERQKCPQQILVKLCEKCYCLGLGFFISCALDYERYIVNVSYIFSVAFCRKHNFKHFGSSQKRKKEKIVSRGFLRLIYINRCLKKVTYLSI